MSKHAGPLQGAADFLKASYIDRWGIVCTSRQQSIAEHQYRVWTLVRQWGKCTSFTDRERQVAEELALTHDLAEIRTGDHPTPFKTPEVKEALEKLEQEVYPVIPTAKPARDLVKFCDTAEAILFLKLYGVGKHAADVRELLAEQMWRRLGESQLCPADQNKLHDLFNETYHDT